MNMNPIVHPFGPKEGHSPIPPHINGSHIPPHMRRVFFRTEFSEADWKLFQRIFEDTDEAAAAIQVLLDAPPEIQILATQLIRLIEEEEGHED